MNLIFKGHIFKDYLYLLCPVEIYYAYNLKSSSSHIKNNIFYLT